MSVSQLERIKVMDAKACSSNTYYSDSWSARKCTGSAALFIVSTAGTLAISQQCSLDNVNWYDPVDTAASALGVIKAAQTVTTGTYVAFSPVLAEWMRIKVVESTAPTTVSLTLTLRVEV